MFSRMCVPGRLTLTLIFFTLLSGSAAGNPMSVEKGVLDLRAIQQGDDFSVRMNGEWEFYFGTFIYGVPGKICDTLTPDCYGKVPGYWNEYEVDGKMLPRFGY